VAWVDNRALPKWNTDNPQVREYLMQIAEHWLHEGIDGWRLDVPFCITSPGFWNEFRTRVKAINPDAYIVGEVWWNSLNYLAGDQFDAVMNYLFTGPVIQFMGQQHVERRLVRSLEYDVYPPIDAEHFADKIDNLIWKYDWQVTQVQLNLLDSHDTPRMLTICGGDAASVRLGTIFLMAFPGAPSVYYGDELGLAGGPDPDCRRTINWEDRSGWDMNTFAYYKQLIALRKAHTALRRGRYVRLYANGLVYSFGRKWENEHMLIALNAGTNAQTVEIPVGDLFADGTVLTAVFGEATGTVSGGKVSLTVPARDGLILKAR